MSEWISVKDRLPEEGDYVLGIVSGHNGIIKFTDAWMLVHYDADEKEWWADEYDIEGCSVTHWMPIPEPPKED